MFVELTALVVLIVGLGILWSNPNGSVNQAFALLSFLILMWLWFVYLGAVASKSQESETPFLWNRANASVAALFPWALSIIRYTIIEPRAKWVSIFSRSLGWLAIGAGAAIITFQQTFISIDPASDSPHRGAGYMLYCAVVLLMHSCLLIVTLKDLKCRRGYRRIQLKFLVFNISSGFLLAVLFVGIGNLLPAPLARGSGFVIMIVAYALAGWSTAFRRLFDSSNIIFSICERVAVSFVLATGSAGLWIGYQREVASAFDLIVGFVVLGSTTLWLDQRIREWLGVRSERWLLKLRRSIIELPTEDVAFDTLTRRLEDLCSRYSEAAFTSLFIDKGEDYRAAKLSLPKSMLSFPVVTPRGWATLEGLERTERTPLLQSLITYFQKHQIGVMLTVPRGSPTPSLVVALGTKLNDWPFSHPEVERLQNIAELMDNILTRSRLAAQAAMQARMEHLAMMSRGLAHDLKNLITPVASFLVHTDGKYAPDSAESEVHTAARRSVRVMTEYAREAMFFADRLNPRYEPVDIVRTIAAVCELCASRAKAHGLNVRSHSDFTGALIADDVLLQRMLTNLVNNSIEATPRGKSVTVSASMGRPGWLRLQVSDEGCGINRQNLSRIFDAYYTTKAFGDKFRGFGLGLAICQKIVQLHEGTINVQSEIGHGTVVTIDLPISPTNMRPLPQH
jgi:signal transduction histidine kinase